MKLLKKTFILSLFYFLLGIIFTFPLIFDISSKIPNNLYNEAEHTYIYGDHLQVFAGFEEHSSRLENLVKGKPIYSEEFCMGKVENCEISRSQALNSIIFSPYWIHTGLNIFLDPVISYNFAILFSFVTSGLSGFVLVKYFTSKFKLQEKIDSFEKSKIISRLSTDFLAFWASLFVTLVPMRIHHMIVGHRNGWLLFLFVLMIYFLEKSFEEKNLKALKIKSKWIFRFFISLLLIYFVKVEQFFIFYGLIYIAGRLFFELLIRSRELKGTISCTGFSCRLKESFKLFTGYFIFQQWWFLLSSILVAYISFSGKLSSIAGSTISSGRTFGEIINYSPTWIGLFTKIILEHEHNIYIGLGVLILLFSTLLLTSQLYKWSRKNLKIQNEKEALLILYFLSFSIILIIISLGSNTPLYGLLYEYVPTFKFSRTPARAMFFVLPMISVLSIYISSSFVENYLEKISKKLKFSPGKFLILLSTSLIFVTIISFHSFEPISLTDFPKPLNFSDGEKILFLPLKDPGDFYGSIYEYYLSSGTFVTINGYTPFPDPETQEFVDNYADELNSLYRDGEHVESSEIFDQISKRYYIDRIIYVDY